MYRVSGERIALDLDGPTVEVEPIHSWSVHLEAIANWRVFEAAASPEAEYVALGRLNDQFCLEAQPTWDIVDHLGAILPNARGMARLPLDLQLAILSQWRDSFSAGAAVPAEPLVPLSGLGAQAPSAVDALIPPGPVNAALKRRLAAAKRRKVKAVA